MKKRLIALLCSLFAAVFLLPSFLVSAEEAAPSVASSSAMVCNLESDKVLFEKNPMTRLAPAPFTKLMTALLAMEYREQNGNGNVVVTEEMLSAFGGGTSMKLKVGETIPFDSLLSGLIVYNANDAALVLATVCGGSIHSFVDQMNERAALLGMENTHYTNPTGIDASAMYTTMEDTVLLCKALYRVNRFMLLSEQAQVTIPATNLTEERVYTNRNALIPYSYVTDYYMEGVRGMIAGSTAEAGWCVATVRQKGNATFLVAVSGGEDRSEEKNQMDISSYRDAKALLEWAEENYAIREIVPKGKIICEKKVRLGAGVDHMVLATGIEVHDLLPVDFDPETEITYAIRVEKDTFTAPIIEGQEYGFLDVLYRGEILATVPLVAQSNVGLSRWLVTWDAIVSFFSNGPAKAALILAIVAALSYVGVLVGTVWLHHARESQAKRRAIAEMNEQENRRMKKVRMEEKAASRARMRRVSRALREGFLVLSGEGDDTPQAKGTAPRKAVARVPEKYRKANQTAVRSATPTPTKRSSAKPVVKKVPQSLHRPGGVNEQRKKKPLKGEMLRLNPRKAPPTKKGNPSAPRPNGQKKNGGKNPTQTTKPAGRK